MARRRGSRTSERCSICAHGDVGRIDFALAKGTTAAAISRQYGLTARSVQYHRENHIPESYKRAISGNVYADIESLLKQCTTGNAESLDVLNALVSNFMHHIEIAKGAGDFQREVQAAVQLRQLMDLRARISQELAPSQHIHGGLVVHNTMIQSLPSKAMYFLRQHYPDAYDGLLQHVLGSPVKQLEHAA